VKTYFVDSWFFIARLDASDSDHARGRNIEHALGGAPLLTHDGVLGEVLTFFAEDGAFVRQRVANAIRTVLISERYTVARFSDFFGSALDLYGKRLDKEYSLVDCASMVLMKHLDIHDVLTNDHHFRQEGFVVVNE
jgi:predicted nucleic acid-binding protein